MNTKYITVLVTIVSASIVVTAADVNLKDIKGMTIKRNFSMASIKESMKKQKKKMQKYGITVVVDPKFDCKSIGFGKKDLFASGTMYGSYQKDGSIMIGGSSPTGDFKAYSYVRYIKNDKECKELSYTKKFHPDTYGKHSIALLFK